MIVKFPLTSSGPPSLPQVLQTLVSMLKYLDCDERGIKLQQRDSPSVYNPDDLCFRPDVLEVLIRGVLIYIFC